MRLYKKLYNVRQICNIAVYMLHSACTIHLLNLPEKTAKRDIIHGVKHLEEVAEDWPCARRTLSILSVLARKWNCELPEEAAAVLQRTDEKYGHLGTAEVPSPNHIGYTPSPPAQPRERMAPDNNFLAIPTTTTQEPVVTWAAMSGMGQPAMMPRYYQPPPFTPARPQQYTLDGKDWFLKDSVNLQQNFESWNRSNNNNSNTIPSSSGDVFMFKGLQESDMDLGDGWDFDSSMTNLDMIPGLD